MKCYLLIVILFVPPEGRNIMAALEHLSDVVHVDFEW